MEDNTGHGGSREGAGRKPKSEEIELIDKLSPLDEIAFEKLEAGLKDGGYNFIKLFMEYRFGKPKETITNTVSFEKPPKRAFIDYGGNH
jgi:hypothetical protein